MLLCLVCSDAYLKPYRRRDNQTIDRWATGTTIHTFGANSATTVNTHNTVALKYMPLCINVESGLPWRATMIATMTIATLKIDAILRREHRRSSPNYSDRPISVDYCNAMRSTNANEVERCWRKITSRWRETKKTWRNRDSNLHGTFEWRVWRYTTARCPWCWRLLGLL